MNIKNILIFVSGLAIGGAAGVFGTRKYFQDKYQKQYEADHEDEEEFEDDGVNPLETDSRPGGRMTAEQRAEIKEKLNKNWEGTTNYASMYKNVEVMDKASMYPTDLAESQRPLDQGEGGEIDPSDMVCRNCANYDSEQCNCQIIDEQVDTEDSCSDFEYPGKTTPEEEAFDDHQRNKNKPPKIISAEAYGELPAHIEKKVLYFYAYDETVVDEDNDDEPLTEPERLIGDTLTEYGFIDNDERIIFVMNYALDTCYEIQKIDASWSDTH